MIELDIDFVKLSLSPLEFIQLASFLRHERRWAVGAPSGLAASRGQRLRHSRLIRHGPRALPLMSQARQEAPLPLQGERG